MSSVLTSENLQSSWGDTLDAHSTGVSVCAMEEGEFCTHRYRLKA